MSVIEFNFTGVFAARPLADAKQAMAEALLKQTLARIDNGGDEEGNFAPLDFARPDGTQTRPLHASGTNLRRSISSDSDADSFWIGSNFKGARVHQFGTIGKGGILPSIVPVRAKALFLPLSPLGAKSELFGKKRFGLKGPRGNPTRVDLIRPGQTRKTPTGRKAKNQTPDYMFVQKVDINPRPFLKVTREDRRKMIAAWFPRVEGGPA